MNDNKLTRQLMAEFLGTFVLMMFGLGVNAQVSLSDETKGSFLSVNVGWGLAVMFGVYACGGVSGAHLNPAVTIALATWRKFPWKNVLPFIGVQMLAAFVASALVYFTYADAVRAFEEKIVATAAANPTEVGEGDSAAAGKPRPLKTAGIWGTYPSDHLAPIRGGLIDQTVGTAMLLLCIFALTDNKNQAPSAGIAPLLVGSIVFAIGLSFGFNCGYAINPARDFGPRLFTYFWGWGSQVFTAYNGFWWVPIVGPIAGGLIGGGVYDLFVTRWHPVTPDQS